MIRSSRLRVTALLTALLMIGGFLVGWPRSARPPARAEEPSKTVHVDLNIQEKVINVLGVPTTVWTYNGTIPGPIVRLHYGDTLEMTLHNTHNLPHTLHTHFMGYDMSSDGSSATAPFPFVPHQNDDAVSAGAGGLVPGIGNKPGPKVGANKRCSNQACTGQVSHYAGARKIGSVEPCALHLSSKHVGTFETGVTQIGLQQPSLIEDSPVELCACKVRLVELGRAQHSAGEVEAGQIEARQLFACEIDGRGCGWPRSSTASSPAITGAWPRSTSRRSTSHLITMCRSSRRPCAPRASRSAGFRSRTSRSDACSKACSRSRATSTCRRSRTCCCCRRRWS